MAATREYKKLIEEVKLKARREQRANKKYFNRFRKDKPAGLDKAFKQAHDEAFAHTKCLDCANCCRVAQPVFETPDIRRISRHFKITPDAFIKKYLNPSPVYEYLTKKLPCSFLSEDNKCTIYEIRPMGCRTYPPAKLRMSPEQLDVIYDNIGICPAVHEMVDQIKEKFAAAVADKS